eukprot:6191882-Pleurochrysis_carterae.AAC.4
MGASGPLRLTSSHEQLIPYHTIVKMLPIPSTTNGNPTSFARSVCCLDERQVGTCRLVNCRLLAARSRNRRGSKRSSLTLNCRFVLRALPLPNTYSKISSSHRSLHRLSHRNPFRIL